MIAGADKGGNGGILQGTFQCLDAVLRGRTVKQVAGKQQQVARLLPAQPGDGFRHLQLGFF